MKMPLTDNHLDKEGITKNFPISIYTLNRYISNRAFPKPDLVIKRRKYWHTKTVEEFFKRLNRAKALQSSYRIVNYDQRRKKHLKRARDFVKKYGIKSPFHYREMQTTGLYDAPDPETLFCYSITFEEIINDGMNVDDDMMTIIKYLRKGMKVKDIADILDISERTVYRKIKKLKELGYDVTSERKRNDPLS